MISEFQPQNHHRGGARAGCEAEGQQLDNPRRSGSRLHGTHGLSSFLTLVLTKPHTLPGQHRRFLLTLPASTFSSFQILAKRLFVALVCFLVGAQKRKDTEVRSRVPEGPGSCSVTLWKSSSASVMSLVPATQTLGPF